MAPLFLYSGMQLLADFGEQTVDALLHQIDHSLEIGQIAIVGVGDLAHSGMRCIVEKPLEAMFMLKRTETDKCRVINIVHGQYEVETLKISHLNLPRTKDRKIISAFRPGCDGARIWRIANMVIVSAGRIELDTVTDTCQLRHASRHRFRGRRSTDIAHTDK